MGVNKNMDAENNQVFDKKIGGWLRVFVIYKSLTLVVNVVAVLFELLAVYLSVPKKGLLIFYIIIFVLVYILGTGRMLYLVRTQNSKKAIKRSEMQLWIQVAVTVLSLTALPVSMYSMLTSSFFTPPFDLRGLEIKVILFVVTGLIINNRMGTIFEKIRKSGHIL